MLRCKFAIGNVERAFDTIDGQRIRYDDPVWALAGPSVLVNVPVGDIPRAGVLLLSTARELLALRLQQVGAETVASEFKAVRLLVAAAATDGVAVQELDWPHVQSVAAKRRAQAPSQLVHLKVVLEHWSALGLPGLSADLRRRLPSLDASYQQKPSPVLARCARRSALTRKEYRALCAQLREAADNGSIPLVNAVICSLILTLAARPCQIATLKVRDVGEADESGRVKVRIPRAKGRRKRLGTVHRTRTLGKRLSRQILEQRERAVERARSTGADVQAAPLIPREERRDRPGCSRAELPGWEGHPLADGIKQRFARTMRVLDLWSDRIQERQHVTPRRARRSVATHLRADGASGAVVADVLDQDGVQEWRKYAETTREAVDRVGAAMRVECAAISAAFGIAAPEPGA